MADQEAEKRSSRRRRVEKSYRNLDLLKARRELTVNNATEKLSLPETLENLHRDMVNIRQYAYEVEKLNDARYQSLKSSFDLLLKRLDEQDEHQSNELRAHSKAIHEELRSMSNEFHAAFDRQISETRGELGSIRASIDRRSRESRDESKTHDQKIDALLRALEPQTA